MSETFAKRAYRSFLSHAHADKAAVDALYTWLTEVSEYRVWYDAVHFPSGLIASTLAASIVQCQCPSLKFVSL